MNDFQIFLDFLSTAGGEQEHKKEKLNEINVS